MNGGINMEHKIVDNFYYIYDDNGVVLFSIELTNEPNNQIIISTENEVYSGPIDFLSFSDIASYKNN